MVLNLSYTFSHLEGIQKNNDPFFQVILSDLVWGKDQTQQFLKLSKWY